MSRTIVKFCGFGTNGFNEVKSTGSSGGDATILPALTPAGQNNVESHYCRINQCPTAGKQGAITTYYPFTATNNIICGFYIYFTDTTPPGDLDFFVSGKDDYPPNADIRLRLKTNGNLEVINANGTSVDSALTPFTNETWHLVEIGWQKSSFGQCVVSVDGVYTSIDVTSDFSNTASLSDTHVAWHGVPGPTSPNNQDIYIGSFYVANDCDNLLEDFLGTYEVVGPFSNGEPYAVSDWGSNLDQGTWEDSAAHPYNDYSVLTGPSFGFKTAGMTTSYYHPRKGPKGDSDIDSNDAIKAGSWILLAKSGATSPTAYLVYGSNSNPLTAPTSSSTAAITSRDRSFNVYLDQSSPDVPTSSEYFQYGMKISSPSSSEFHANSFWCFILHTPED